MRVCIGDMCVSVYRDMWVSLNGDIPVSVYGNMCLHETICVSMYICMCVYIGTRAIREPAL